MNMYQLSTVSQHKSPPCPVEATVKLSGWSRGGSSSDLTDREVPVWWGGLQGVQGTRDVHRSWGWHRKGGKETSREKPHQLWPGSCEVHLVPLTSMARGCGSQS